MSLFQGQAPEQEAPSTPCDGCGSASYWTVWGHQLCDGCYGAWAKDPRFYSVEVDQALGLDPWTLGPEYLAKRNTEYTKRTAQFVGERRKRAA